MILIRYHNNRESFAIKVTGHAGTAPQGQDIVCAAVSVLVSELMIAARKARQQGTITMHRMEAQSGNAVLAFAYKRDSAVREVVNLVLECLHILSGQYPYNITIKREKT